MFQRSVQGIQGFALATRIISFHGIICKTPSFAKNARGGSVQQKVQDFTIIFKGLQIPSYRQKNSYMKSQKKKWRSGSRKSFRY